MYQLKNRKLDRKSPKNKIPFECPRCHWMLRLTKPDNIHPIPLTSKPSKNDNNDILLKKCVCRNPRCQQNITIYWSKPQDFYDRI